MVGVELGRDTAERLAVRLPRKHCTGTLRSVASSAEAKNGSSEATMLGKDASQAMASAIEDLLDYEDDRCLFCSWSALKMAVGIFFTLSCILLVVGGVYALHFPAITTYGQRDMQEIMGEYEEELRSRWQAEEEFVRDQFIDTQIGRVMFVGDPQIEGDGRIQREGIYGRLNVWFNDVYIWWVFRRNLEFFKPAVVIVVGDLVSSQYVNFKEFQSRAMRLKAIFHLPEAHKDVKIIYMVGNHDIGYGMDITVERVSRFERMFGKTNSYMEFLGHRWLMYDAQQLDGSRIADYQRQTWLHLEKYGRNETLQESGKPLILLGHIPLFKDINKACSDHYHIERTGQGYVQEQTMLTKETSDILLSYHPILSFSGHDHNGCFAEHAWTHNKSPLLPHVIDAPHARGRRGRLYVEDEDAEVMRIVDGEERKEEGEEGEADEEDFVDGGIATDNEDDAVKEQEEEEQEEGEERMEAEAEAEAEAERVEEAVGVADHMFEEVEEEEAVVAADEEEDVDALHVPDEVEVELDADSESTAGSTAGGEEEEEETGKESEEAEEGREAEGEAEGEEGEAGEEDVAEENVEEEGTCYEMTVRSVMGDFGGHMVMMEMQQYREVGVKQARWQYAMLHSNFGDTHYVVTCVVIVLAGFIAALLLYFLSCCRITSRDRVKREKRRLARRAAASKKRQ